jgi:hypothetical protein
MGGVANMVGGKLRDRPRVGPQRAKLSFRCSDRFVAWRQELQCWAVRRDVQPIHWQRLVRRRKDHLSDRIGGEGQEWLAAVRRFAAVRRLLKHGFSKTQCLCAFFHCFDVGNDGLGFLGQNPECSAALRTSAAIHHVLCCRNAMVWQLR